MVKILLIRHAFTDALGKIFCGRAPGYSLNEEGRQQAHNLAIRLKDIKIAALYCSPLERAIETAGPLIKSKQLPCLLSEDYLEIDCGAWTNKSFEELGHDPAFQRFNQFRSNTRIPGGELMGEAQLRIVKGIEKLHVKHPGQTVAIISHSDLIKAAIAYYAGIPLDLMQRLEINPTSVSSLEIYEDNVRILQMNEMGFII